MEPFKTDRVHARCTDHFNPDRSVRDREDPEETHNVRADAVVTVTSF